MNIRKECNRLHNIVFDYEYKFYVIYKSKSNYKMSKKMKRIIKKYMQLFNLLGRYYDKTNSNIS